MALLLRPRRVGGSAAILRWPEFPRALSGPRRTSCCCWWTALAALLRLRHDAWAPTPRDCPSLSPGYALHAVICRHGVTDYVMLCTVDGQPPLVFGRGDSVEFLDPFVAASSGRVAFVYGLVHA